MRKLFGTLGGLIVGYIVVMVIEGAGHTLYPPPVGADMSDPGFVDAIPAAAKVAVAIAWFLGALAGGYAAIRFARWRLACWIVIAVMLISGVSTLFMIPHPLWMQASAVVLPILAGLVAERLPPRAVAEGV